MDQSFPSVCVNEKNVEERFSSMLMFSLLKLIKRKKILKYSLKNFYFEKTRAHVHQSIFNISNVGKNDFINKRYSQAQHRKFLIVINDYHCMRITRIFFLSVFIKPLVSSCLRLAIWNIDMILSIEKIDGGCFPSPLLLLKSLNDKRKSGRVSTDESIQLMMSSFLRR